MKIIYLKLLTIGVAVCSIFTSVSWGAIPETKRIILCLDGTWNNPGTPEETAEKDRVYKPTNVLKTCRSVLPQGKDGQHQISYYDIGVGGLRKHPGGWNTTHRIVDNVFGGARGAGYEGNVEDAYRFLAQNYSAGDEVYIFGFSRGAATARTLTQFINWAGGLFPKTCAYWLPRYFDFFLEHHGKKSFSEETEMATLDTRKLWQAKYQSVGAELSKEKLEGLVNSTMCVFEGESKIVRPVEIAFLGLWDTVLSIGRKKREFYVQPNPVKNINFIRHALAINETRYDFKPYIYQRASLENPSQVLEQKWFAGVHSNIGGGYIDDGLANHALYWVIDGARKVGLELDESFIGRYKPYAQDRLYNSRKWYWSIAEGVRLRYRKGVRAISPAHIDNNSANLSLHYSALERLASCKKEGWRTHRELKQKYRPKNIISYLSEFSDLKMYLRDMFPDKRTEEMKRNTLQVDPKVLRERIYQIVRHPDDKTDCR